MTYNPLIPQPTDRPSKSQAQMLANFGQANTIFGNNHVPFDDSAVLDRGFHKFSTYVQQGGNPAVVGTNSAVYTKNDTVSSTPESFFINTSKSIQITRNFFDGLAGKTNRFSLALTGAFQTIVTVPPLSAGLIVARQSGGGASNTLQTISFCTDTSNTVWAQLLSSPTVLQFQAAGLAIQLKAPLVANQATWRFDLIIKVDT